MARPNDDIPSQRLSWATPAAAAFTPTVIFVSVPNNVILRNLADLPYCPRVVGMFLLGFAASWMVSFVIMALAARSRFCRLLSRAGLVAGACVLVWDVAGSATQGAVHSLPLALLIDVAVVAATAVAVSQPRLSTLSQFFGVVALVLLAQGVATHVHALTAYRQRLRDRSAEARARIAEATGRATTSFDGNIYHIILDGFQTEAYEILAARNPAWRFDGFTYYPRFKANYFFTEYSIPELMTGRLYGPGETFSEWLEEAKTAGMLAVLASHGFELTLYPHQQIDCSPLARSCNSNVAAFWAGDRLSAEVTVIDLWFVGLLPRSLDSILAHGWTAEIPSVAPSAGVVRDVSTRDIFSLTHALLPAGRNAPVSFSDQLVIASVANFHKAIAEESMRPGAGQYVFIHPMLPHAPTVMDANCNYKGPGTDPHPTEQYSASVIARSYLDQAQCGLHLVQELTDQLKNLHRFDQSLIIVQADHGMDPIDAPGFLDLYPETVHVEWGADDDNAGGFAQSSFIGRRSHALLLVKFPGRHAFSVSNDPVEMLDLAPTVLAAVGLRPAGYSGIAIQSFPDDLDRPEVFFGGSPDKRYFAGAIGLDVIIPEGHTFHRFELQARPGRYVRVQLRDTGPLSLAEVEVVGGGGSNLALNRTATQSSTVAGHEAGRAVDGGTEGDDAAGSVTQTRPGLQPWWEVDLGAVADIREVRVWNRTDASGSRLSNFYVLTSSNPIPVGLQAALRDPAVFHVFVADPAGRPTTVQPQQWKHRGDIPVH
jgi:hypothetical protein